MTRKLSFQCGECRKVYSSSGEIRAMISIDFGISSWDFCCTSCAVAFLERWGARWGIEHPPQDESQEKEEK